MKRLSLALSCLWLVLFTSAGHAALRPDEISWNQPVTPFKIIGDVYYVGASDITSYLIVTPKGLILLDSGFVETVPQVKANIAALGFKLSDVKVLLNSHAHYDHAWVASAELKRLTHAAPRWPCERSGCGAHGQGRPGGSPVRRQIPLRAGAG